jgi:DNA-binding MarR family transcriptional regulator
MIKEFDTEAEIVVALRRIIRAVDLQSKYLAQASGLTGPQLLVLQHLAKHGSQTTGEVGRAVSVGQATLSDILERLEGKGLVRRERSRQDKRRVINELTQSGKQAVEAAPPLLQERFVRELVNLEDWEQTLILSILQRVAKMMNAEEIEASPVLVSGPFSASAQETAEFLATGEPSDDSEGP